MTVLTGTYETFTQIGIREDLSDIIYNISPTETPFMMMMGRGTADNTKHEWQIDALIAADADNKVAQGEDDSTVGYFPTVAPTSRVYNYTQISRKSVMVSGTAEVVDKAGRKSELAYQLAKQAKELKRDMESILTAANAGGVTQPMIPGVSGTAAQLAPYETWMTADADTPANRGAGGAGSPTDAAGYKPDDTTGDPVDGTQRAFKEADLKEVIREAWTQGGDPSVIMVGPFNKQALSAFSGNTTRFDRSEDMRLVTAVDVYVSDFGEHRVVPNRFSRDRSALVITPRMWSCDYLRGFRQFALAKTGDAEKRTLLAEYTLRASNPRASGIVADLTTS
jgi:hypothetical protein